MTFSTRRTMAQTRVLVLRGDPGIGKTSLLDLLVDGAAGFTVFHATRRDGIAVCE